MKTISYVIILWGLKEDKMMSWYTRKILRYIELILIGAVFSSYIISGLSSVQHTISGCSGIDYYYTNISFYEDYLHMSRDYYNCYSNDHWYNLNPTLKDPRVIINCSEEGFDCEDFSHAIMCLADKYDVDCEIYSLFGINHESHEGVRCRYGEVWQEYN